MSALASVGVRGAECPLTAKKIAKIKTKRKEGTNRDREKSEKRRSETKGKNQEGSFPDGGGEGATQLFGRYVPHVFPKVGFRKQIFFEKLGVLGTKVVGNFGPKQG